MSKKGEVQRKFIYRLEIYGLIRQNEQVLCRGDKTTIDYRIILKVTFSVIIVCHGP